MPGQRVLCFNPRAREGRDEGGYGFNPYDAVSIHAPVKGATVLPGPRRTRVIRFNPRAREGRDRTMRNAYEGAPSFNPRAREGRDCGQA